MAIKLTGNYAKRLGLPGYSSHQFSVSVETELTELDRVPDQVAHLYCVLQEAVDREIQQTGFVPGHDYGQVTTVPAHQNGNGNGNGHASSHPVHSGGHGNGNGNGRWNCSDKQAELIRKLAQENHLDDEALHQLALDRFGVPLPRLNKLQASGLIDELLEHRGSSNGRGRNGPPNGHRPPLNGGHARKGASS